MTHPIPKTSGLVLLVVFLVIGILLGHDIKRYLRMVLM